jgi:hypothetical protein
MGAGQHFEQAQQNSTQYSAVYSGVESQGDSTAHEKTSIFQEVAVDCQSVRDSLMDDIGLEPKSISTLHDNNLQKFNIPRAVKSDVNEINSTKMPDDLLKVINAWSTLSDQIKQAVILMIQTQQK